MFYIDAVPFDFWCDIERTSKIEESDNSGMMLNGNIKKDPIATYLTYDVTLVVPLGQENLYSTLYEIITNPVKEHTFVFPYNQNTIEFKGFISTVSDRLFRQKDNVNIWRGTKFTVEMIEPLKVAE